MEAILGILKTGDEPNGSPAEGAEDVVDVGDPSRADPMAG